MKFTSLSKALLLGALTSSLFATNYSVDPVHSQVGFKIKHMMISNVNGYFTNFDGTFSIEDGKLTALNGNVDVTSVDTQSQKRDGHLNGEDFFHTEKFPKMNFVMTKNNGDTIEGKLTMRGVTKDITLVAELGGEAKDQKGKQRAGVALSGTINRTDYGVSYQAGSALLADNVKILVELEGVAE